MSVINPRGCQVFSFKHPSATELLHDFLWRTTRDLPERGPIGIFNRSYYEEVLIARVHPEILRSEGLPDALLAEKAVWHDRYRSIVDPERHLHGNGTRIAKEFTGFELEALWELASPCLLRSSATAISASTRSSCVQPTCRTRVSPVQSLRMRLSSPGNPERSSDRRDRHRLARRG
ncbi:hypothetical protein [Bradyrhizobium sp.]|jgi:hypothetical protein|uniref:hypothetical protein n=1 Tax=Bradyrhizobium sp. TaxID=376 RepID=UPI003C1F2179